MIWSIYAQALDRIHEYAQRYDRTLGDQLGSGADGIVLTTLSQLQSAIKSFIYEEQYIRERDVYLRLADRDVTLIQGFNIPRLLHYDDSLWVIETEVVRPPYIILRTLSISLPRT